MICTKCNRRLRASAVSCLCGWSVSQSTGQAKAFIACCFSGCLEGAICSIPTKTGMANICRTHYVRVERYVAPSDTPYAVECREAYRRSPAYQRQQMGGYSGNIGASLTGTSAGPTRQPGQDDDELPLGVARDSLEAEFMEGA